MYLFSKPKTRAPSIAAAVIGMTLAAFGLGGGHQAYAVDLKVYSPIVEEGEFAIETRGNVEIDKSKNKNGAQDQRYAIEYSPTSYWHTALYGKLKKEPGGSLKYEATAWENVFQLFEQGEKWIDLGFYVEYEMAGQRGSPDALEWKILAEKSIGQLTFTVNPIFEKELGANATKSTELKYATRVKWRLMPQFEPAIEAYGDFGEINNFDSSSQQRHQIGPVILGKFKLGNDSALKYEVGYLFGLTRNGSPDGAFKWLLEFERHF
jgi:hypothetical protein